MKIILITLLTILTNCNYIKGQENKDAMNNQIPANTLATFEIDNSVTYLVYLNDPTQYQYDNDFLEIIGNGDYYILYDVIQGNYPQIYSERRYYLHIIPKDNYFRLERRLVSDTAFENKINVEHSEIIYKWIFAGNSNDTSILESRIYEYYIKSKKFINIME
jgi:hypothetical protein